MMTKISKHKLTAVFMACLLIAGMGASLPATMGAEPLALVARAEEEAEYIEGTYGDLTYRNYGTYIEISKCDENATSVEIPSEIDGLPVTNIAGYELGSSYLGAFQKCINLTSVTISENVTSIGNSAFYGCDNLTSVIFPNSVTSIGNSAFSKTPWLAKKQKENPLVIVNDILIDGTACSGDIIIPESVTVIGDGAFITCTDLTSVTIPNSVTVIEDNAFWYCTNLSTISISDNVTSIGAHVFTYCTSLISVDIPNSVTKIGWGAFGECTSLTSVTIPDSITTIEDATFSECTSLTSVIIPDSVTTIGCSAFEHTSLSSINIPKSVISIGVHAFEECESLTSIIVPDGVTTIEDATFSGCTNLTSVCIPNSVTNIEWKAFERCENLTDIYYTGTESEWYVIEIDNFKYGNDALLNATIHFNSTPPQEEQLEVSVSSLIELNKALRTKKGAPWKYDLNGDKIINVIDLALLKRQLLGK